MCYCYFTEEGIHAESLQSCPTLFDPMDCSLPGSSVLGILPPGKNTGVSCHFLFQCMKLKSESEVIQLCPTLSDPMDFSPPGSSIHGIFQARVLEWGAIAFSEKILGNVKKKRRRIYEWNFQGYDCEGQSKNEIYSCTLSMNIWKFLF